MQTSCAHNLYSVISGHLSSYAVSQYDPTRTTALRNQFARDMRRRFAKLCAIINKAVVTEDCFALRPASGGFAVMADLTTPGKFAFDFPRSGEKVNAFMSWLEKQERIFLESQGGTGIRVIQGPQMGGAVEDLWANKYVESAYQRGIMRARQELISAGYSIPTIAAAGGIAAVFNQPFHLDRVGLVYSRVYSELKGITSQMDTQISRILAQGMADGRGPRELARMMVKTITGPVGDLGLTDTLGRFIPAKRRAEILARTEIIRAHHMATIQEYKNWGAAGVKVTAEWKTAGDGRVCDECAALQGRIFSLAEIERMIPLHPQCRCVALPVTKGDENVLMMSNPSDFEKEAVLIYPGEEKLNMPIASVSAIPSKTTWGQCTQNALAMYKNKNLDVFVGTVVDASEGSKYQLALAEYNRTNGGTIWPTEAFAHAWNVKDNKIFDYTLGKDAKDYLYFGRKVPVTVLKNITSGDELANWHTNLQ